MISLYNAISGSGFPPDTPVTIATLEDVLYNLLAKCTQIKKLEWDCTTPLQKLQGTV